jgi:hypothetical protein
MKIGEEFKDLKLLLSSRNIGNRKEINHLGVGGFW